MRYEIDGQRLTDIADAIRDQTGGSATIAPENMPTQIRSISGGGDLPSGGCEGQVLTIVSGEPDWADVPTELPDGGTEGYLLAMGSELPVWLDPDDLFPGSGQSGDVLTYSSGGLSWENKGLPSDGSDGKLVGMISGSPAWVTPDSIYPSGGTAGQVLTKTANGVAWETPSGGGGLPSGGLAGQALVSDGNGGAYWVFFPTTGSSDLLLVTDGSGGALASDLQQVLLGLSQSPVPDGMVLMARYSGTVVSWESPLPSVDSTDAGKVLMVNSTGEWVAATLP